MSHRTRPSSRSDRSRPIKRPPPLAANGFSLIELMITIAITLFLMAGLIGLVIGMQRSFGNQNQLTSLQDDQRFLLTVLGTTIHNAGFFSDPVNNTLLTALPASSGATADGSGFAAGQFISGTTASGSGSGSDTLNLRYQTASGDGIMSCLGDTNTSGAPVVWTNSFAINAASQLTCAVGQNGAATGTAAVLTDNVAAMRVLYGVDTAGSGSADTYLDAAAVSASGAWSKVYSVQLVLTFHDSVNSTTTTQVNLPKTLRHTFYLMNQP